MNPWPYIKHLFEMDSGELPDILVEGLSPDQVVSVYDWLMKQCIAPVGTAVWSVERGQDVPIQEIPNVARAVIEGGVACFRHGLVNLRVGDVLLPALTVFVGPDGIEFDYRMGAEWNEKTVAALFDLLCEVRRSAPQATISQAYEGEYKNRNPEFATAFEAYALSNDA